MPVGKIKLLFNHGDGGHNGIKNIVSNINSKSFLRLKIGISKNHLIDMKDYVLGKFNDLELSIIKKNFDSLSNFVSDYVTLNRDMLIQKYNSMDYNNS